MKRIKWLCLLLTLCLFLPAVAAGQGNHINWSLLAPLFENGEELPAENGEESLQLGGLEEQGGLTLDPIAPFLDLSWQDVEKYGDTAYTHVTENQVTKSGLEYTVKTKQSEGSTMLSGTISVEDDDYSLLKALWLELGEECISMFDTCETVEGVDGDSKAAYAFTSEKTYLRYEFIDAGDYRFIIFVALKN